MAECVVHLAGDPFAFLPLALLDSQLLLGLGADGSLGQRRHQLPPGPYDDAPRGQRQAAQRRDADRHPVRRRAGRGIDPELKDAGGNSSSAERQADVRSEVHRRAEQREHARAADGWEEHRQHDQYDGQTDRPPTPQSQRKGRRDPGRDDQPARRVEPRRTRDIAESERPEQEPDQHEGDIHHPVARGGTVVPGCRPGARRDQRGEDPRLRLARHPSETSGCESQRGPPLVASSMLSEDSPGGAGS